MAREDRIGRVVGALTIERWCGRTGWGCRCACGRFIATRTPEKSRDCGCGAGGERRAQEDHRGRYTVTYNIWRAMLARCSDPKHPGFHRYGGRGIDVCERWRASFTAFRDDMGERPEGGSIDRIDNDRGYQPGNCRWANAREQARNKSSNRILTAFGLSLCVAEWAERQGIPSRTIVRRLTDLGWCVENALTVPVD